MARKTKTAEASAPTFVKCVGYALDVQNSNTAIMFDLQVDGEDGNQYRLRVDALHDNTGLVQKVMRLLADRWPSFDFEFSSDADGNITDVR